MPVKVQQRVFLLIKQLNNVLMIFNEFVYGLVMLLSRKKALVMISLNKTQEGRAALGLCLEQLLCIILTAQNDDPMQKHVLIVDFKSFFHRSNKEKFGAKTSHR